MNESATDKMIRELSEENDELKKMIQKMKLVMNINIEGDEGLKILQAEETIL